MTFASLWLLAVRVGVWGRLGTGFSTRPRLILLWMSLRVDIVASVVIAIITIFV